MGPLRNSFIHEPDRISGGMMSSSFAARAQKCTLNYGHVVLAVSGGPRKEPELFSSVRSETTFALPDI